MKISIHTKLSSSLLLLAFPLMVSCSVLSGGGYSNDPLVAAQQQRIDALKEEVQLAERETEDAEQREKAAKSRLKAAQDELKVFQNEAKNRSGQ
jgi:Tfp pilus assembly protein PilN